MEIVGPPMDYTIIPPISTRKTHALLSNYVLQTVDFVNKFTAVCEQKLNEMSRQLERLETTMSFLEAKLASIPGLESVTVAPIASTMTTLPEPSSDIIAGDVPSFSFDDSASVMSLSVGARTSAPPPPPPNAASSGPTIQDDPRFAKYFKMLKLGVPMEQVRMKMRSEGADPSVLENPSGSAASIPNQEDSDDAFSDDEKPASDEDFSD